MGDESQSDFEFPDIGESEEQWAADDIEQAYMRALDAISAVEEDSGLAASEAESTDQDELGETNGSGPLISNAAHSFLGEELSAALVHGQQGQLSTNSQTPDGITPRQIIEAALFVGGTALVTKKICSLFQGEFDAEFVERTIDEMNSQYERENRPYEICFGEGGYRMQLRSAFDAVSNRVYGYGPKEVRLSQESLEILALVAYHQPVTKEQTEAWDRPNAGAVLRQLLRRQLVAIERGESGADDIRYVTTNRFLSLFGLGSLSELPHPEDLELK